MTTRSPSRMSRLLRGIGALIVLAAVVAGIPLLLASVHMVPHSIPSLHELGRDLKQRDNGQLAPWSSPPPCGSAGPCSPCR